MKAVIFTLGDPNRIESRVAQNIGASIARVDPTIEVALFRIELTLASLRSTLRLRAAHVVIVHSPLALFLPVLLCARIFHIPVVSIVWDSYPVFLGSTRFNGSLKRRLLDELEGFGIKSAKHCIVPTADFFSRVEGTSVVAIPFWPPLVFNPRVRRPFRTGDQAVKFIFAGQINAIRGLADAVLRILKISDFRAEFHIASGDPLPSELEGIPAVRHLGFVHPRDLVQEYFSCDFGLVCLATRYQGPAFPSKTLEYLRYGLPILYHGPVLEAYVSALSETGVGIDITSKDSLRREDLEWVYRRFDAGVDKFVQRTCLTDDHARQLTGLLHELSDGQ